MIYKVESDVVVLYRWVRECLCRVMSEEVDGVEVPYVLGACAGFLMRCLRSAESLLPALRGWCSRYDRMHCTRLMAAWHSEQSVQRERGRLCEGSGTGTGQ
jgi:hypothetical protein